MRTIHKFNVERDNTLTPIAMPRGARILHGDFQRETLQVWAEVDVNELPELRKVIFVGTGRNVPNGARYVNSFMAFGGALVFHLYAYDSEVPGAGSDGKTQEQQ